MVNIPYPLIRWVMLYPTSVPWTPYCFFDNIDDFCIAPIEPRVMFFFVQQFLFEKIEGETCLWHFFR